jgi:hypothetical protein
MKNKGSLKLCQERILLEIFNDFGLVVFVIMFICELIERRCER